MRLIDADALEKEFCSGCQYENNKYSNCDDCALAQAPTIEERKKGMWIPQNLNKTDGMVSTAVYYYPKCSVCGHCANYTNFCPNCGADMREGNQ